MSLLVAGHVEQKEKLDLLLGAFKEASVNVAPTKKELERKVNAFPDEINEERNNLTDCTENINSLNIESHSITWFTNVEPSLLTEIKDIIEVMHHLHKSMLQYYVIINKAFALRGILKEERRAFKATADDVKEIANDLNDRFFVLPQDEEFQDLMNQLNDL